MAARTSSSERVGKSAPLANLFVTAARPIPPEAEGAKRTRMEIDLLCADSRLVVEVDGAQHLADPVAYRRDRRKDQLLQENGYLVLRYLAEDLARELDSVLDGILRAVSSRQKSPVVTNTVSFLRGSGAR